jgi:hypothetical protein
MMFVLAQSDDAIVFATWVMATAAAVYTGFTIWLAVETHRLRRVQSDPCIVVRVTRDKRGFLYLVAKNVGAGTAFDIQFYLAPPYNVDNFGKNDQSAVAPGLFLIDDGPFASGVPALGAGESVRQVLGHERLFWEFWKGQVGRTVIRYRRRAGVGTIESTDCGIDIRAIDPRRLGEPVKVNT